MSLQNVYSKLENINSDSSRIAKEKLIKEYCEDPLFVKVATLALNPYMKFNTTQVDFNNATLPDGYERNLDNLFNMLDYLSKKKGATNEDIQWLSAFASIDKETVEVVRRIINQDLRCGASINTFKKFIKDLPSFGCMLCDKDIDKFLKLCNNDIRKIVWSIKLDGVRCLNHADKHIYYSRNGKEFPNFAGFDNDIDKLTQIIRNKYPEIEEIHFDGEVTASSDAPKDFQKLMTQVQRHTEVDSSIFVYTIFDIILDDLTFGQRYDILKTIFRGFKSKIIKLLPHHIYPPTHTKQDIIDHAYDFCAQGYEGLVVKNIDSKYVRKRSKEWCKIKQMHTIDCPVVGFEHGKGKYEKVLGKLFCRLDSNIDPQIPKKFNGNEFGVGSGFDDAERQEFLKNLPELIEVKYQELTNDGIPRFPIFVRVRDDK